MINSKFQKSWLKLEETLLAQNFETCNLLRSHSQQNSSLIQSCINALETLLSSHGNLSQGNIHAAITRNLVHGPEMDEKRGKSAPSGVSPPERVAALCITENRDLSTLHFRVVFVPSMFSPFHL